MSWIARIRGCACLLVGGVVAGAPALAQPVGTQAAATLPIADIHFHPMLFMSPADLLQHMDAHNVRWAGGAGALGDPPRIVGTARDDEFQAALKDRYVRPVGLGDVVLGWVKEREAFFTAEGSPMQASVLQKIEKYLQDGRAGSIAEIHINSRTSAPLPVVNRKVPADSVLMKRMMDLSARYQAPVSIHMQFDPDSVQQLQALLEAKPQGILVLAHCGKDTAADQVRPLLQKYPNLYCDLSYRSPPQEKGRFRERIIFTATALDAPWRALIEEFPDRFMVGVDDVTSWREYDEVVDNIRTGLLSNLTAPTAEKVASGTAVKLFKLK